MLNTKHNLKSGNSKDKKKGLERNKREDTPKKENIDEENFAIEYFNVVPFMKQKQRRKKRKERAKRRSRKKANKRDKKEERKKKRERDREREREKEGGQKRLREKERETLKIDKKCHFLGENKVLFVLKSKERKGNNKKNKKKQNKEGLGPSEVAL